MIIPSFSLQKTFVRGDEKERPQSLYFRMTELEARATLQQKGEMR